jgi:hypothetical protein
MRLAQAGVTRTRDQAPTGGVCVGWNSSTRPPRVKALVSVKLNSAPNCRSEILQVGSA